MIDEDKPRSMREVADKIAVKIQDSPRRGHDVSSEPRMPKGRPVAVSGRVVFHGCRNILAESRTAANLFLSRTMTAILFLI